MDQEFFIIMIKNRKIIKNMKVIFEMVNLMEKELNIMKIKMKLFKFSINKDN